MDAAAARLGDLEERTLRQYEEVYRRVFRRARPDSRRPAARDCASKTWKPIRSANCASCTPRCDLRDFAVAEPAIRSYLDSIAGYEKNRFPEVEPPWKAEVARRWRRCFDEWGYAEAHECTQSNLCNSLH